MSASRPFPLRIDMKFTISKLDDAPAVGDTLGDAGVFL
jgi:hypothetical protein